MDKYAINRSGAQRIVRAVKRIEAGPRRRLSQGPEAGAGDLDVWLLVNASVGDYKDDNQKTYAAAVLTGPYEDRADIMPLGSAATVLNIREWKNTTNFANGISLIDLAAALPGQPYSMNALPPGIYRPIAYVYDEYLSKWVYLIDVVNTLNYKPDDHYTF